MGTNKRGIVAKAYHALELGGTILGCGLVETIVVVLLIVLSCAVYEPEAMSRATSTILRIGAPPLST
jgi:hypothetical protein